MSAIRMWSFLRISIHAPREGGDRAADAAGLAGDAFQSTPPAKGATVEKEDGNDD